MKGQLVYEYKQIVGRSREGNFTPVMTCNSRVSIEIFRMSTVQFYCFNKIHTYIHMNTRI
jgi:hypothetical protein